MHALFLIASLVALASPTKTPSAEEQRLFDEGTRAFAAGDARAAERAWLAGYAIARDPAFLVHVGEAEEKAGAPGQAVETYRRYLREAPDASDRPDIEARLARLAPAAPPPPPPPAATPGSTEQTGEFGGAPASQGEPGPPAPAAPRTTPGVDAEGPPARGPVEDSGWNAYNVTGFVAAGAAVLLLGTAGFFAAQAGSDADDVNLLIRYRDDATGKPVAYSAVASQYERAMADGPRHDRYAKAALIGAAGAAVVSTVFFLLDAKATPEPAVAIAPTRTGLGAIGGWTWRF